MSKKSIILHLDSLEILNELNNEQKGILFEAIYQYNLGNEIELDFAMKIAFLPFKNQFKRDFDKYEKVCERNKNNGAKGGRPEDKNIKISKTGKIIPESTNKHFLYLIQDINKNEFKIGETSNLLKRRDSIKRSSFDLIVYDFVLLSRIDAINLEKDFISKFINNRISGDWFNFNENELKDVLGFINSQKTHSDKMNPKKADNDNDNDNDSDSDNKNDNVFDFKKSLIDYGFEKTLVNDWLKIRKTKKATNTETAFKKFIKEIEKNGNDKNKLFEYIVSQSWSGFKSEWKVEIESNQTIIERPDKWELRSKVIDGLYTAEYAKEKYNYNFELNDFE
jgi:hypothetical protein